MKFHRIWAVMLRHFYNYRYSPDRISDSFYWPLIDIVMWGFTAHYIQSSGTAIPNLILMLMSALVLWNSLWRGQYEITVNLLEEMWSRNLVNLFSSPLKIGEWIIAVMLLGFSKLIITESVAIIAIYILYAINVLSFGWYLLPFFAALLITGWAAGFFVAGLIIGVGTKIQTLAWSGAFLLAPFSGVYYPISTLPEWAQKVASIIPSSYIFEGMREVLFKNTLSTELLIKSFLLDGFYLILALSFFIFMFNVSKRKGLSRLE